MKTSSLYSFLIIICLSITLYSCGDTCTEIGEFVRYEPVFIDQETYERDVSLEEAREVVNPGVIARYGDYLFINEYNAGIHIINNKNPEAPTIEGFLQINNNKHFAIKDGIVLANRYGDLVAVDIKNTNSAKEVSRITNVFPDEAQSTDEGIISHYIRTSEREKRSCDDNFRGTWWEDNSDIFVSTEVINSDVMTNSERAIITNQGTSVSSSAARFTIAKNTLYVLNSNLLEIFNIHDAASPVRENSVDAGWGSETLFPLNDFLFVGANSGMTIFDLQNPTSPNRLSTFQHANACDPVVANEQNAFVTLRSGNACAGFTNQLEVINIENIRNPIRTATFNLRNPRGLTLMGNHLIVCDGEDGVVIFNIENEDNPFIVSRFSEEHANDVLPVSATVAVVSGENGIFELDLSDIEKPSLLSVITR